ncbi:MAG: SpoVR family protein, partial [Bdellovibrionota bacterium]
AVEPAEEAPIEVRGFKNEREYMSEYINPPSFLDEQRKKLEAERAKKKRFPEKPQRDILQFLVNYAPLETWERDVLSMLREEAYYFEPQGQTKITNEGWASYWHSTIMTQKALKDSELIDYADHHSGTLGTRPGVINPYKLGIELFRHIEERWNKGKFGKDYDTCDDMVRKKHWDKKLGLGRQKIFDVRRSHNDITFIDEFFTEEFCEEQKLYTYQMNPRTKRFEIKTRDWREVKEKMLAMLTNGGQPLIRVVDANHKNRAELLLKHEHHAQDLDLNYARATLANVSALWGRPASLETQIDGVKRVFTYANGDFSEEK